MKPEKRRTLPVVWSCLIRMHEHGTEAEAAACIARHEATDDLYAALRAFVDYYEGAGIGPCPEGQDDADEPDGFDAGERYNVRRARATLAKARGGEAS